MIASIEELNNAIEDIETENEVYPAVLEDKMDASAFNSSCAAIEDQLNQLYEKIRLIEDVDNFTRRYVTEQIKEKEDKLRKSLKIIEQDTDLVEDKASTLIEVPLGASNQTLTDRDGSPLTAMTLRDGELEAACDVMAQASVSLVTMESNTSCYNNSYQNLVKGEAGISTYSLKEAPPEGIRETVTLYLEEPTECNYAGFDITNCTAEKCYVMDKDHVRTEISSTGGFFPKQEISGIVLELSCKTYTLASKYGEQDGYDESAALGTSNTAYSRYTDEQLVKEMEKSQEESDRKNMVSVLSTKCDTWSRINSRVRKKNIVMAGEE